jgi:hypothetical protein
VSEVTCQSGYTHGHSPLVKRGCAQDKAFTFTSTWGMPCARPCAGRQPLRRTNRGARFASRNATE